MARASFWGQALAAVLGAHEGMLLWLCKLFVALKMAKEAESMDRMMREQLKPTPRRANLAMRTRVFIFWMDGSGSETTKWRRGEHGSTHHVLDLLLLGRQLALFENVLLAKGWTERVGQLSRGRAGHLDGALEG